jgi:hypothetical protein
LFSKPAPEAVAEDEADAQAPEVTSSASQKAASDGILCVALYSYNSEEPADLIFEVSFNVVFFLVPFS